MRQLTAMPENLRMTLVVLITLILTLLVGLLIRDRFPVQEYPLEQLRTRISQLRNHINQAQQLPLLPDVETTTIAISWLGQGAGIRVTLLDKGAIDKLSNLQLPENDGRLAIASINDTDDLEIGLSLLDRLLWLWSLKRYPVDLLQVSTQANGDIKAVLYLRGNTRHNASGESS
ncbi:MAG: hypothetical protein JAZ11_02725 [Candidatus Thiodiazotropha lotti]|nr:hypothetical protein [Candidatus Thiodiazotropha lotti]